MSAVQFQAAGIIKVGMFAAVLYGHPVPLRQLIHVAAFFPNEPMWVSSVAANPLEARAGI